MKLVDKLNLKSEDKILIINNENIKTDLFSTLSSEIENVFENKKTTDANIIIFLSTKKEDVQLFVKNIFENPSTIKAVWIGYPKLTSKEYKANFSRGDFLTLWKNVRPVSLISLDDNISLMRIKYLF